MIKMHLLLPFLLMLPCHLFADQETELVFIVHAENPSSEVKISDVRDYFFKRKRQWPNGESVRFIDRTSSSQVREIFLKKILEKTNSDIDLFWIGQKLYTGDSAPLRENSDRATIQFVSSFKGAIGYISSTTSLTDKNVKVVTAALTEED